ncbi:uncharacterized protein ARMOST_02960 [Armillaria ostoyae]|uniref:Uncharacterized protein n=1 Tax=Armillaria ostoyae TaxID=47428 RepID=A0A284QT28_ARMOS|nr:uncharacterized protein ARMOST_02960 [Armillaria ostoyae]
MIPHPNAINCSIKRINLLLHPPQNIGREFEPTKIINQVLQEHFELMLQFLQLYTSQGYTGWTAASDLVAHSHGQGLLLAHCLHEWYIEHAQSNDFLPTAYYEKHNSSILEDEDLADEIHLYLQGLGKYIKA